MNIVKLILIRLKIYTFITNFYDQIIYLVKFSVLIIKLLFVKSNKFFFFPFYHTGGAELIHAKIIELVKGNKVVFFTHTSANNHFKNDFEKYASCFEIKQFLQNRNIPVRLRD